VATLISLDALELMVERCKERAIIPSDETQCITCPARDGVYPKDEICPVLAQAYYETVKKCLPSATGSEDS
jgi:hypothetical protein